MSSEYTCDCQDSYGTSTCIAYCAAGIDNSKVYSLYMNPNPNPNTGFTQDFYLTCGTDEVVLGKKSSCTGIQP